MHKKRAIDIVEQVHENILNKLEQLNSGSEIDGKIFIEYLQEIASALVDTTDSLEKEESLKSDCFENEYKSIADTSLDSYANTSDKLHKFTREQQEIIDECQGDVTLINQKQISDKFAMIQTHMNDEVSRANGTIRLLNNRV
ncbi:MAG: hypothetical protein U9N42_08305, partial [Campylobacterota bacterium]|nr:hypothetical protein [Campylobacterota bacterium]